MMHITSENIEKYRGDLVFEVLETSFKVWDIFDHNKFKILSNTNMISIDKLISTKNQLLDEDYLKGLKKDPRQNAFELMKKASLGEIDKREPLKITNDFHIIDGNATAQVLMLLSWKGEVPVEVIENVKI